MFGIYRYGLAFCVVISHLWEGMIGGPAAYAVWGFYCLSGYLMTLILNEKYGFTRPGLKAYAANRGLRIFPAYYAACLFMIFAYRAMPGAAMRLYPFLHLPESLRGWLHSLTLFFPFENHGLVPGSTALHVELWFYLFMALGLARGKGTAIGWFLSSVLYTGWLLSRDADWVERYTSIPACSLAFSLGALIYHFRDRLPVIRSPWAALVAAALWWLHVRLSWELPGGPFLYGLYTSLVSSAIALVCLMRLEPKRLPHWLARLDHWAGNLSYPIYLCHFGAGIVTAWLLPDKSRYSKSLFVTSFLLVNVMAFLVYQFVERPVQSWKFRAPVRERGGRDEARRPAEAIPSTPLSSPPAA